MCRGYDPYYRRPVMETTPEEIETTAKFLHVSKGAAEFLLRTKSDEERAANLARFETVKAEEKRLCQEELTQEQVDKITAARTKARALAKHPPIVIKSKDE